MLNWSWTEEPGLEHRPDHSPSHVPCCQVGAQGLRPYSATNLNYQLWNKTEKYLTFCLVHSLRIHLQLCCLKHNKHAFLEKRKRWFRPSWAFEPDHRQIGLCTLPLTPMKSVQSTPPNARWVPNARVLIYKIDPLSPSPLLFRVSFTIKRYGMKQYPFLFVSNIATTKNNTSLGRIASVLISYDQNHNTLQLVKIIVRVLRHKLHSTHSLSASSTAWQWVIKSQFSTTLKIHRKFQLTKNKNFCAILLRIIQRFV